VLLLLAFTFKEWDNSAFHLAFFMAMICSLFGMILSLGGRETKESEEQIDIHKVGQSSGVTGLIALIFVSVIACGSILFLPFFREGLQAFARAGGSGFVWLFHKVGSIFSWLLQWFPSSDEPGDFPEMQQGE